MSESITSTSQLQAAPGWRGYAKAIIGALTAGITYLIGVIPASGGFEDVTLAGWLGCALAMLTVGGGVYVVPNATKPTPPADILETGGGHPTGHA